MGFKNELGHGQFDLGHIIKGYVARVRQVPEPLRARWCVSMGVCHEPLESVFRAAGCGGWALGFKVCGSWFGVHGLGFRVWGPGFRVQGLGVRVWR